MPASPLPRPDPAAAAHSEQLAALIRTEIAAGNNWLSFARFMELALYAPGLGYYAAGAQKFGAAGDFVTAPEMTPLFGRALARPLARIMQLSNAQILEAGAGSGRLAADLLGELEQIDSLPERYAILELSPDLRQRQEQTLRRQVPHLLERVVWLNALPTAFSGAVVANELLDAMPVHLVVWREEGIAERGLTVGAAGGIVWGERPAQGELLTAATALAPSLPPGFCSEIALAAPRWVAEWGRLLQQGALLLIDYGFPRREYYHWQRGQGTLMCHYRHLAHPDPLRWPGLQDITAHVDFTAIVAAGHAAGLDLLGYTTQGAFLLQCGLLQQLERLPAGNPEYLRAAGDCNRLLLPHEMGELFKVMALGKGIAEALPGFAGVDQSHRL